MPRAPRLEYPDALYHVTSRGNRREALFIDDQDRAALLDVLERALHRFDAGAWAYCLMGNHYHLVLQTRQPNLSSMMRFLNGHYGFAFNKRHGRVGHVFEGRFHAVHVDRDAYLLNACRYVELNPVRAGLVTSPAAWKWSSYRANAGLLVGYRWLVTKALHAVLLADLPATPLAKAAAGRRYAEWVDAGRDHALWQDGLRDGIYLGDAAFVEDVRRKVAG